MMSDKCPRRGADQLQIAELEKRVAELEVPEYWRGRVEGAPPTATEVELAKDTQTEALLAARERIAELEKRIAELGDDEVDNFEACWAAYACAEPEELDTHANELRTRLRKAALLIIAYRRTEGNYNLAQAIYT